MPYPAARLKTLIVEDSPRLQNLLSESLQSMPALELVAVTDTAADALAGFDGHRPDVVILDLVLREGRGLDVLSEIKRRAPWCRVVVFTGYDTEQYRARCLAAGADHFFSKGRQHRDLLQYLHHLVGNGWEAGPEALASPPP